MRAIRRLWTKLAYAGILAEMEVPLKKRIGLSNHIAFFFVVLSLTVGGVIFSITGKVLFFSFFVVIAAYALAHIWLNTKGHHTFTRFSLSVVFPLLFYFLAIVAKLNTAYGQPYQTQYIAPRILLISFLILPVLLQGDLKQRNALLSTCFLFALLLLHDPIHSYLGLYYKDAAYSEGTYNAYNFVMILASVVLVASYSFLSNINQYYEKQKQQLVDVLHDTNRQLMENHAHLEEALYRQEELNEELSTNEEELSQNLHQLSLVQTELEKRERLYRLLSESSRDLIHLHDVQLINLYASPSSKRITGYDAFELKGRPVFDLIHPDDVDLLKLTPVKMRGGTTQFRLRHRNGHYIWLEANYRLTRDEDTHEWRIQTTSRDITEQKRTEGLLLETQELANIAGWEYDIERNRLYWTKQATDILELPADYDLNDGKSLYDYAHPDDLPALENVVDRCTEGGVPFDKELRIVTAKGQIRWVRAIGQPRFSSGKVYYLFGSLQDITTQKSVEDIILQKQSELQAFVEAAPAAIAMFDLNMSYVAASERWLDDYALKGQDIIGESHYKLFPDTPKGWKNIHKRCLNGAIEREEEDYFLRENGQYTWMRWEVRPWFAIRGDIGGIIVLTEDISARKEQEQELIQERLRAEEASQAKARFLSVMSHEIRTPLNGVVGITNLLLEENPRPNQTHYLKALRFSADNLLVLINDILDFNKMEEGMVELEQVGFNLQELTTGIQQTLHYKAAEKEIALTLHFDEAIPLHLVGDPVRLGQVLNNLVSNAIKFTEKGGVTLRVTSEDIAEHLMASIKFEVVDTGIGIPTEKQEVIFERFTQANSNTMRKYGGTGLGLSITKKLLELMGSKITVESTEGQGSTFGFILRLPVAHESNNIKYSETLNGSGKKALGHGQLKILMVEDNEVNRLVAGRFLKHWGLVPDYAENGLVALRMAKKRRYDLILMDLQMPKMDGYEATKAIRKIEGYNTTPIIALTASVLADIKKRIFAVGMDDFVSKPFHPDELYRKIRRHSTQAADRADTDLMEEPAMKAHDLGLAHKINDLASGDDSFKMELAGAYADSMDELSHEYKQVMLQPNAKKLKYLVHKHKATIDLLGLNELAQMLEEGRRLVEQEVYSVQLIEQNTQKVLDMCQAICQELKAIIEA